MFEFQSKMEEADKRELNLRMLSISKRDKPKGESTEMLLDLFDAIAEDFHKVSIKLLNQKDELKDGLEQ